MARKKSIRLIADQFKQHCGEIEAYLEAANARMSDEQITWCYDYGIIRLYREFEHLVLEALIGAINNNTATISQTTGYNFPEHITDEICQYLVVGTGYFDFKGRKGLLWTIKKYIPAGHYLLDIIRKAKYSGSIEKLSALRNHAAHGSPPAKKAALLAIGQHRMGSSGSWLKRQHRFLDIAGNLGQLADEIHAQAPY